MDQAGSRAPPYKVDLDNDTATQLAQQGATVLMLGVPPGSGLGIDHQAFTAGPKFKGVKMLPPGTHFVSVRATNIASADAAGGMSPPTGVFLHLAPKEVVVKSWDIATEALLDMPDEDEAERYRAGVRRFDFDQFLAPYDLSGHRTWRGLSSHITPHVITTLSPIGGLISIMSEADDPDLMQPKTPAEHALVKQLQEGRARRLAALASQNTDPAQAGPDAPGAPDTVAVNVSAAAAPSRDSMDVDPSPHTATPAPASAVQQQQEQEQGGAQQQQQQQQPASTSGRCFYTHVPRLVRRAGATASELTAMNLDKSGVLQAVLQERYKGDPLGLLGELQYAFVAFVFGQSLDGFMQWKSLLLMLLGCEHAALHTHQAAFVEVLRVLRAQLAASLSAPAAAAAAAGRSAGSAESQQAQLQASMFGSTLIEELLPDSFLKKALGGFFEMLVENTSHVSSDMMSEAQALKQLLRSSLRWEFDMQVIGADDDEMDEEGPVIVDTSEPYAL
eukprot:CAMPEP_0202899088 /NCGR_PEP_ID=MMETSP1392-20130828/7417_1 /ASSEMBLY_ACC=CAM_ASM_000868 /TAXON_ID=225041 /ORGANISM="Chlamydomonas chlamydogama, Strain SAG 11-48b" /LENGTH=502 /DNA_ID=CAMNT_0049585185 /DNA_START=78 /DNA_END=1586 /DNA_ORIENTATION=+